MKFGQLLRGESATAPFDTATAEWRDSADALAARDDRVLQAALLADLRVRVPLGSEAGSEHAALIDAALRAVDPELAGDVRVPLSAPRS